MAKKKKYYVHIFWDYPDIEHLANKFSIKEFKRYLEKIKTANPILFNLILKRFIERGHLTEAFKLFSIEDIEEGLNKFHKWKKIPEIRMYAWRHAIEFMYRFMKRKQKITCQTSKNI